MVSSDISWASPDYPFEPYSGPPRNVASIDNLAFDPKLQPREYHISGTSSTSKILILDVNIVEATGREPYRGDVLIIGEATILLEQFYPINYTGAYSKAKNQASDLPRLESSPTKMISSAILPCVSSMDVDAP